MWATKFIATRPFLISMIPIKKKLFHSSTKLLDFSEFFDSSKGWSWSEGELKTGETKELEKFVWIRHRLFLKMFDLNAPCIKSYDPTITHSIITLTLRHV